MKTFVTILFLCVALTIAQAQSAPSLQWNVNPASEVVTSYKVYEHVGAVYNLIATVPAPAPPIALVNYSLAGVPTGAHVYAVTAINVRGESLRSAEVTFPATPTAPTGLNVIP